MAPAPFVVTFAAPQDWGGPLAEGFQPLGCRRWSPRRGRVPAEGGQARRDGVTWVPREHQEFAVTASSLWAGEHPAGTWGCPFPRNLLWCSPRDTARPNPESDASHGCSACERGPAQLWCLRRPLLPLLPYRRKKKKDATSKKLTFHPQRHVKNSFNQEARLQSFSKTFFFFFKLER